MKNILIRLYVALLIILILGSILLPVINNSIGEIILIICGFMLFLLSIVLILVLIKERINEKKEEDKNDTSNY